MKLLFQTIVLIYFLFPTYFFGQEKDSLAVNSKPVVIDTVKQNLVFGTITNDEGIALSKVIVTNKTDFNHTISDEEGYYEINAIKGDTLAYLFFNHKIKEIRVEEEKVIDIILEQVTFKEEMTQEPATYKQESVVEYALSVSISESEEEKHIKIPCLNAKRLVGQKKYDSRFEKSELDSRVNWQSSILKQTESIAIIIEKERLYAVSDEVYQLDLSNTLEQVYNLCSDQIFAKQPVVGTGTGFIVETNAMITAKHVFERSIEDYVVVFGFELVDVSGMVQSKIMASDIFYPKHIEEEFEELDVVKFTVDRAFNRPVLEWENSRDFEKESEIYMIGYPSGLPLKIALNAGIVDNSPFQYFYTSLDGFQGNSGSPIFNLCSNKVIGVLVAGELDYEYNGNCYQTTLCKYPYCKGEKVIRIENILNN